MGASLFPSLCCHQSRQVTTDGPLPTGTSVGSAGERAPCGQGQVVRSEKPSPGTGWFSGCSGSVSVCDGLETRAEDRAVCLARPTALSGAGF